MMNSSTFQAGAVADGSIRKLCDAPEARFARLPVGEGGLPLREFMDMLPARIDVTVEVPLGDTRAALPPLERAKILFGSAKTFLDGIGWGPSTH